MNRLDVAREWNRMPVPLRVWLTALMLLLATVTAFGVYRTLVPNDPVPACVQAEAAGRSDPMGVEEQCLELANAWCSRHYAETDNGLCLDKIYGVVPSDYDGSHDPLDAQH